MIKPPASTPASTPSGQGKGKEFEGRLPAVSEGVGISRQPATQDNSVVSPVSPVRRGGRESIAPTVMSPVPADDPKPEPTPDPKPEPTASSNDNPVVDAGGPPQDPPTDGPSWSETPEPEEDPLEEFVRRAAMPVDTERRGEVVDRLRDGVIEIRDRNRNFVDIDTIEGEGEGRRTNIRVDLLSTSGPREVGIRSAIQIESDGKFQLGIQVSYALDEGQARDYTYSLSTSPEGKTIVVRRETTAALELHELLPPPGQVSAQTHEEAEAILSERFELEQAPTPIEVGYPEVDFIVELARQEGVIPTPTSVFALQDIHQERLRGRLTGLEPDDEESARGAEELARYVSRFLGDETERSEAWSVGQGVSGYYEVTLEAENRPTVKLGYESAIHGAKMSLIYTVVDGRLQAQQLREIKERGIFVTDSSLIVQGDVLEARRVRNFLANPSID